MKWGLMTAGNDHFCFLNSGTEASACLDIMTIVNISLLLVFFLGAVAGACALSIWQKRKAAPQTKVRSSQSGNVFFALFAAVGMVGVLGASMSTVMRGPVTSMATVTKRTIAENNVIASGKLAIVSATTQQPDDGDCDADSFVEPIPYRDAGASPHPAGGGYIPTTIGASMTDPWQIQYGYCAWDHGAVTVSDNDAGCGGSGANRLEGAPSDTQMAVAIISAGPDMVFQTQCNGFVDVNADNVPDVALVNKPGGSDDIVLGHTYAEANAALGGLWGLKSGTPETATIDKDIEVEGNASFEGSLILGGGLLLPDQTTSGACAEANDQQLRRNTSGPSLEICIWGGGPGAWVPIGGGGGAISGLTAASAPNTINNAAHQQTWNWDSATTGMGLSLNSTSVTNGILLRSGVTNTGSTGVALMGSTSSTSGGMGVMGQAAGATGANIGVLGQAASTSGTAVSGTATAGSGTTYGVAGTSASPSGFGVSGSNTGAAGTGVQGVANSGAATGVLGLTSSTTNNAAALKGTASGASGLTYGVLGSSASGTGFGVAGTSTASAGTGVYGVANTGAATGVLGATSSTTNGAAALKGTAGGGTGTTYGVYGSSASTGGTGVYGTSPFIGVYGQGTGTSGDGVYGETTCASCTARAIFGVSSSTSAQAIRGNATAATGNTYAGLFANDSTSGIGVYSEATTATGTTYGVSGVSQSSAGTGVAGTGGLYGVLATTGASGVNFGIAATTGSASGYGGYFNNTGGGWGLFSASDVGLTAGKYLNWGTTRGTTGYGIWDDAGVIKVKNSGGSWTAIAGGAETDPQVGTLTNGKWCTTNGTVIDCTSDAPGGGGTALSGITAAGGANTIDNAGHLQTWDWNSLTTGQGLRMRSTSITSGTLLQLWGSNTSMTGNTLYSYAANGLAIYGDSGSSATAGAGVLGLAQASATYGVMGSNSASGATAIYGIANNSGGTTTGVHGRVNSTAAGARGVYGQAAGASGANYGVYGTSASATGYAGYFDNTSTGWGLYSADDAGLAAGKYLNWGATQGSTGYGIRDNAGTIECKNSGGAWAACAGGGGGGAISALTAAAGANTINNANNEQRWNWNSATNGIGLYVGSSSMTTGSLLNAGISNTSSSGRAISAYMAGTGDGVWAQASGTGANAIYGYADLGTGVKGEALGSGSRGVHGYASHASGANFGVYGQSASTSGSGVYGVATASGANFGVHGVTYSTSGYAGYFDNMHASGGWGVYTPDDLGVGAGKYMNFGATRGSTGYGIRDNGGTIQYKNSSGTWTDFGSAPVGCIKNITESTDVVVPVPMTLYYTIKGGGAGGGCSYMGGHTGAGGGGGSTALIINGTPITAAGGTGVVSAPGNSGATVTGNISVSAGQTLKTIIGGGGGAAACFPMSSGSGHGGGGGYGYVGGNGGTGSAGGYATGGNGGSNGSNGTTTLGYGGNGGSPATGGNGATTNYGGGGGGGEGSGGGGGGGIGSQGGRGGHLFANGITPSGGGTGGTGDSGGTSNGAGGAAGGASGTGGGNAGSVQLSYSAANCFL